MSQQNIEWFFPHGKCESRSSTWTAEAVLQIHCTGRTRIWVVVFKGDLFIPKGWRVSPNRWKGQVFTIPKKVTTTQNCQVGEGKFHELEKSERSSPFLERNEKRVFMKPLWMIREHIKRNNDILLMEEILHQYGESNHYLKEFYTSKMVWLDFFHQQYHGSKSQSNTTYPSHFTGRQGANS